MNNFENMTGIQIKDHFKSIIYDADKLTKELNLECIEIHGVPSIRYDFNFFLQYSIDPRYITLIQRILDITFQTWINQYVSKGEKDLNILKDNWILCLQEIMRKGNL